MQSVYKQTFLDNMNWSKFQKYALSDHSTIIENLFERVFAPHFDSRLQKKPPTNILFTFKQVSMRGKDEKCGSITIINRVSIWIPKLLFGIFVNQGRKAVHCFHILKIPLPLPFKKGLTLAYTVRILTNPET